MSSGHAFTLPSSRIYTRNRSEQRMEGVGGNVTCGGQCEAYLGGGGFSAGVVQFCCAECVVQVKGVLGNS